MFSPQVSAVEWEIWLFTAAGDRGPVQECGLFRSRAEAERTVGALLLWLQIGTWCDEVLSRLRPKDQRYLFRLRQTLRRDGLAAGDVRVEVRVFGLTGDNQMDPPDAGDDDDGSDAGVDEPTPIVTPVVTHLALSN